VFLATNDLKIPILTSFINGLFGLGETVTFIDVNIAEKTHHCRRELWNWNFVSIKKITTAKRKSREDFAALYDQMRGVMVSTDFNYDAKFDFLRSRT
jgi:hypothetical protein